ncbi:MAG TPA: PEP-CTERM sorting domain-containing protein [Burkholderiaceae bacterium]|nr:PEP-CTERM sorting domain-containing protein [Burkholderiaceae bacterium]
MQDADLATRWIPARFGGRGLSFQLLAVLQIVDEAVSENFTMRCEIQREISQAIDFKKGLSVGTTLAGLAASTSMGVLMRLNYKISSALAAIAFAVCAAPAQADYVFSGAGMSGNLAPGVESWSFNFDGGAAAGSPGNNWGSPGVGAGLRPYSRAEAAYGFDITFVGGSGFLAGSVATGNGAACAGSTFGGTTFCTISDTNIWIATVVDANTIAFRAQDESFVLETGQNYFVNIFFAGATPTSFSGRWLTEFSPDPGTVPEPGTLALLGLAAAALALTRRKA